MTAKLDSHSVALYLEDNPLFFEDHPELMASLRLNTQLGGRTVSLQERQVEVLREKAKVLELKLVDLARIAKDNDAIIEKLHHWILTLLTTRDEATLPDTLLAALRKSFGVPAASLRIWDAKSSFADAWFTGAAATDSTFADQLARPYCGPAISMAGIEWLEDSATMQSVAIVALRKPGAGKSFGLLVMGSPDAQRFSSELATDFLVRIGETASAALQGLAA